MGRTCRGAPTRRRTMATAPRNAHTGAVLSTTDHACPQTLRKPRPPYQARPCRANDIHTPPPPPSSLLGQYGEAEPKPERIAPSLTTDPGARRYTRAHRTAPHRICRCPRCRQPALPQAEISRTTRAPSRTTPHGKTGWVDMLDAHDMTELDLSVLPEHVRYGCTTEAGVAAAAAATRQRHQWPISPHRTPPVTGPSTELRIRVCKPHEPPAPDEPPQDKGRRRPPPLSEPHPFLAAMVR